MRQPDSHRRRAVGRDVRPRAESVAFSVLGPLEVHVDGELVAVQGSVRRRVLCALLRTPGRPVSLTALLRAAWGEAPPQSARRSLQAHLSRLRALGLDVGRALDGYHLDVAADQVDAHRFRALARAEPDGADWSTRMRTALSWWRGEPFADLAETMVVAEALELVELRRTAEEHLTLERFRTAPDLDRKSVV